MVQVSMVEHLLWLQCVSIFILDSGGGLSLFNSSGVKTRQEAGLKPKCSILATGHMGACSNSELNWCPVPEYFCPYSLLSTESILYMKKKSSKWF